MNKTELVNAVAEKAGFSKKDAEKMINATIDWITEALVRQGRQGSAGWLWRVREVKTRAARIGRNPKTKEAITIPESKSPVFKAGKALKDVVSK